MLHTVESRKSVDEIAEAFPEVAKSHQFGVLATHDLKEKMREKGVDFERDCLIFEVCNPQRAKEVLEKDMNLSTMLPCRISVYRDGEVTRLVTLKPTALVELFGQPELQPVAASVEQTLIDIMNELA